MDPKGSPTPDEKPKNPEGEPLFTPIRREAYQSPITELSASLDTQIKGFLSVRVTFLGEPVADLHVQFFRMDGSKVNPVKPELMQLFNKTVTFFEDYHAVELTNGDGWYGLPFPVPVDSYLCEIEHQPKTLITTVEVANKPFSIVLPIGRSYHDFYLETFPGPAGGAK